MTNFLPYEEPTVPTKVRRIEMNIVSVLVPELDIDGEPTGVELEEEVFCGPSMVFTNVMNPRAAISRKKEFRKTLVRKGVSIGANATIVCGNEIGKFAFIGAGAVVTKEVLPYELVVGNPARHIGWMSEFGHRLEFDGNGIAICPESKEKYQLLDNNVTKLA